MCYCLSNRIEHQSLGLISCLKGWGINYLATQDNYKLSGISHKLWLVTY